MYCVSAQRAADRLKATNVSIISVGVGSEVDLNELRGLASRANDVFMVNNFDALDDIQEEVNHRTCEGRESSVSRCESCVFKCESYGSRCESSLSKCESYGSRCESSLSKCESYGSKCESSLSKCESCGSRCESSVSRCKPSVSRCGSSVSRCKSSVSRSESSKDHFH